MKTLLFDLDGTVTDSKIGITNCIRYAMEKMDRPCPDDLDWCIGPPLIDSFTTLMNGDHEKAVTARDFYRERFSSVGLFESALYPDIPDILKTLSAKGFDLYIATAKVRIYAEQMISHFNLDPYFKKIYGAELDGTHDHKDALIAHILEEAGMNPTECLMIGDREHDMMGAQKNAVAAIGVLWGYGGREELEAYNPIEIVHTPQDLLRYLLSQ